MNITYYQCLRRILGVLVCFFCICTGTACESTDEAYQQFVAIIKECDDYHTELLDVLKEASEKEQPISGEQRRQIRERFLKQANRVVLLYQEFARKNISISSTKRVQELLSNFRLEMLTKGAKYRQLWRECYRRGIFSSPDPDIIKGSLGFVEIRTKYDEIFHQDTDRRIRDCANNLRLHCGMVADELNQIKQGANPAAKTQDLTKLYDELLMDYMLASEYELNDPEGADASCHEFVRVEKTEVNRKLIPLEKEIETSSRINSSSIQKLFIINR